VQNKHSVVQIKTKSILCSSVRLVFNKNDLTFLIYNGFSFSYLFRYWLNSCVVWTISSFTKDLKMTRFRKTLLLFLLMGCLTINCDKLAEMEHQPQPLRQAHAHNDYDHKRPLFEALDHGFTSIEADIILRRDTLFVAHDPEDIQTERTLSSLYLDPLYEMFEIQQGAIAPEWPTVYLMIDIKSDADSTYQKLRSVLSDYSSMLTSWQHESKIEKAVTIILSGNRPIDMVRTEETRVVGLDGRFSELEPNAPAFLFPWISENWTDHFEWRGIGEIPKAELEKLFSLAQQTRDNGQLLRFWATDSPSPSARNNMWRTLIKANVGLVNTDDLAGLAEFLQEQAKDR
jgi:hypothetical protein